MAKAPRNAPELGPQDAAESPSVLTIEEAAQLLRIGRNSAYEAARRGQIPTVRIGRRLLVPRAALERVLEDAGAAPEDGDGAHGH
jgi:excisionase family DNA binding protein